MATSILTGMDIMNKSDFNSLLDNMQIQYGDLTFLMMELICHVYLYNMFSFYLKIFDKHSLRISCENFNPQSNELQVKNSGKPNGHLKIRLVIWWAIRIEMILLQKSVFYSSRKGCYWSLLFKSFSFNKRNYEDAATMLKSTLQWFMKNCHKYSSKYVS